MFNSRSQAAELSLSETKRVLAGFDLAGHPFDPIRESRGKAVVLIFVSNDCPISNRSLPEVRRLQKKFTPLGLDFWLVHPDPSEAAEAIRKHADEYSWPGGLLRDPDHRLVARAQAKVTPEAAVFVPGGELVYHGRIDNQYVDFGQARPEPTQRDLEGVLEQIVAGKKIVPRQTRAIGCYIADLGPSSLK